MSDSQRLPDSQRLARVLDEAALKYLERFDASIAKLRTLLLRKGRTLAPEGTSRDELEAAVTELVARYQRSGIVDDARFAEASIRSLRQRGLGERAIVHRLSAKGVEAGTAREALGRVDADQAEPELEAALRFVRRRKLGPHRTTAVTAKERRKDLQALARAGFSYEVAQRALGAEALDADAF
ncbi:MAG TPA: regulatory protein RecX [Polyangiaceae bacterium]